MKSKNFYNILERCDGYIITDKPTDIIALGTEGILKHLTYAEVLSPSMVDNIVANIQKRYTNLLTIEVRHNGKLAEYIRITLD